MKGQVNNGRKGRKGRKGKKGKAAKKIAQLVKASQRCFCSKELEFKSRPSQIYFKVN